jgi:hypothetical protein
MPKKSIKLTSEELIRSVQELRAKAEKLIAKFARTLANSEHQEDPQAG